MPVPPGRSEGTGAPSGGSDRSERGGITSHQAVTVDLREGFTGQTVRLVAPGLAPVQLDAVRTRLQIGLAGSQALALPAGELTLRIELPTSDDQPPLRQDVDLPATRPLWVGVSLARSADRLEVVVQAQPFGYV